MISISMTQSNALNNSRSETRRVPSGHALCFLRAETRISIAGVHRFPSETSSTRHFRRVSLMRLLDLQRSINLNVETLSHGRTWLQIKKYFFFVGNMSEDDEVVGPHIISPSEFKNSSLLAENRFPRDSSNDVAWKYFFGPFEEPVQRNQKGFRSKNQSLSLVRSLS